MTKHSGHAHDTGHLSDARLVWAIALNVLLSVVEVVAGVISGSLALIADAAHNFSDCMSLVVTLIARIISRKDTDRRRTFGYRRAEVIGAFVNLLMLTAIGFYLLYEAAVRCFNPREVLGGPMIIAAGIALIVDVATVIFLRDMARGSINLRAGFLHKITDALASVGVIIGGVLIWLKGWHAVDLVVTVAIAGFILWQSLALLKPSVAILMESVPAGVDLDALCDDMASIDGVLDVHHVHIWELDEEHRALEAHVVIDAPDMIQMEQVKFAVKQRLRERYSIRHSTLEFELAGVSCPSPTHEAHP